MKKADIKPLDNSKLKEQIYEKYIELRGQAKVAKALDIPEWTVRKAMAEAPPTFRTNLIKNEFLDTIETVLQTIQNRLVEIPKGDVAWLWKMVEGLIKAYHTIETGDISGKAGAQIQNIINLSKEETKSLTETMNAVEGEVIDHSDD